jgi:protein O-GlcNAc transferase
MPTAEALLRAAQRDVGRGDLAGARRHCERLLQQAPTLLAALRMYAVVLMRAGAGREAIGTFRRVLARDPDDVESLANLAALLGGSDDEESTRLLERALRLRPGMAALHYNLGNALLRRGRLDEALPRFDAALRLEPGLALAHNNRGSTLRRLGRLPEARAAFERAVALDPTLATARSNLGVALATRGDWSAALVHLEEAVRLDPSNLESRGELAGALVEAGRFERAFEEFERALALAPDNPSLWYNLGTALMRFGDVPRAIAVFGEAVRRSPEDAEAHANLAQVLVLEGRPRDAIAHLERVAELAPGAAFHLPVLLTAKLQGADWEQLDAILAELRRVVGGPPDDCPPLAYALGLDEPETQLAAARRYAAHLAVDAPTVVIGRRRPGRVRVAYVSPDFGEHPVAHSIVEVLERHDRARVELIGVSVRRRPPTPVGTRIAAACERFEDAAGLSDGQIGALLARLDVDVAVDLAGYTMGSRPRIFAARGARVQAGYLGYPGTTGSPWLDYLIADATVIPAGAEGDYSERIVRLSGCFFPSDTTQRVDPEPTRAAAGLPESGIVYACLTRPLRILPDAFAAWMRILAATEGSVLWINATGEVREALRRHAAAHGVEAGRLRFPERVESRSAYLGRLRLADLCLDTFPYAGHSTVRDALWAGVPVVTLEGRSFPARVAPSLLRSAGLGDWVAPTWDAYEALAVASAREPERLASARRRLQLRDALPLFDTARLSAALESAYECMLERALRGEPPADLTLAGGAAGEADPGRGRDAVTTR